MFKCLPRFEVGYSRDQILLLLRLNCLTYIDGGVYISDKFRTKYLSREFFKFVKKFTGLELNWFLQYT